MDGTLVFLKTPRGIAEISLRSAQLPMTTRRVLIMIDGKRNVDDLSIMVKPGEIEAAIASLESGGLIQRVLYLSALDVPTINGDTEIGNSSALGGPSTTGLSDRDPVTLDEVKRRAIRGFNELPGLDARALITRIENCRTIEDFRSCVREAERLISASLGPDAAQDYLKALRRRG